MSVRRPSPTTGLVAGLVVTLAAVVAYSWYINREIDRLRALQSDLADRSRRGSLQLLRIQNNLNLLALAMRDMLDTEERYPLTAWTAQLDRIRLDLEDALEREEQLAVARRTPEQRRYLDTAVGQFWDAVDRVFGLARAGDEEEARAQIRLSLQARQAALSTSVARLLVENNEVEEEAARRVQEIYGEVQRQVYWFLSGTLVAIVLTTAYLIRSNRRLFAELASLSDQRRELARNLIAARESTLRHVARELHDDFGQILTAIGSMLTRASRHAGDSPLQAELREARETAHTTLERIRQLSQSLHPSILEELGLESAIAWYISTAEKQLGLDINYEQEGTPVRVDTTRAIHAYRVLQEALSNVARHSGASQARVRLRYSSDELLLDIEDHGKGLNRQTGRRGLGMVTMAERAELLGGTIDFISPRAGGTLVRLRFPAKE